MGTMLAFVLAMLAAAPQASDPVPTSTGLLASEPAQTADVSAGVALSPSRSNVLAYAVPVAVVGVAAYELDRLPHRHPAAVPEPASLAVLGVGAYGLRRRCARRGA